MRGGLSWLYAGMNDVSLNGAIRDIELDLAIAQGEMRDLIENEQAEMRVRKMRALSYTLVSLEDCLRQAVSERDYRAERRSRGGIH